MDARIRTESPEDQAPIRAVHIAAFGRGDEANLVDALRHEGVVLLSLVAEFEGKIVGHVLFTRIWIVTATDTVPAAALAPAAVLSAMQRRGIGSQLIRCGLDLLCEKAERIVTVLGDRKYYSRFGFSAEQASSLKTSFPAFNYMSIELSPRALEGISGRVKYPTAFGILGHSR